MPGALVPGAAGVARLEPVLREALGLGPLDGHMVQRHLAVLAQAEVEEEEDGPRHGGEEAAIAEVTQSDAAHGRPSNMVGGPSL